MIFSLYDNTRTQMHVQTPTFLLKNINIPRFFCTCGWHSDSCVEAVLGSLTVVCACRCPRMYVSVIQIDFFVDRGRRIQRGNSMYVVVERIHPWPCYLISLHILVLSCVRFFSVSCIFRQLNLDFFFNGFSDLPINRVPAGLCDHGLLR